MVSYYKELENDFYLPIINKKVEHSHDNETMSKNFFSKYNPIFDLVGNLKIFLSKMDLTNFNCDETFLLVKLKNNIAKLSGINTKIVVDLGVKELEEYLLLWGEIFDLLYSLGLYKIDFDNYIKLMQLFNSSLIWIARVRGKLVDVKLPNTWLITSKGYLYNTNSSEHAEANYKLYYEELNQKFLLGKLKFDRDDNKAKEKKINILPEFNNTSIITANSYVRETILDICLHYINYILFNKKSFDPRYLQIIVGMLEIKKDYYDFLRKLYIYTDNPIEELERIIALTNNNYDDVLIRCCGVSKVLKSKGIVTSSLTFDYDFQKYIVKGWDIQFCPPLIINKEKRVVEEYSNEFLKVREFRKYY